MFIRLSKYSRYVRLDVYTYNSCSLIIKLMTRCARSYSVGRSHEIVFVWANAHGRSSIDYASFRNIIIAYGAPLSAWLSLVLFIYTLPLPEYRKLILSNVIICCSDVIATRSLPVSHFFCLAKTRWTPMRLSRSCLSASVLAETVYCRVLCKFSSSLDGMTSLRIIYMLS